MKNYTKKFSERILNLFLPKRCINCQKEGSFLCQDCLGLIEIYEINSCPICSSPKILSQGELCPLCKKLFFLDGLIFAVSYSDPIVKKAISLFKYPPFIKDLADPLSFLIISQIKPNHNKLKDFFVSFVPITQKRKKFRGFNQAEEIAKRISKELNLPIFKLLAKTRETKPQVNLKGEERKKNIEGVFSLLDSKREIVTNSKILLVDDVFTTGATLNEAAKVLKKEGAKMVIGIVIAKEF